MNNISTALTEVDMLVEFQKMNHPSQKRMISSNMANVGERRKTRCHHDGKKKSQQKKDSPKYGKKEVKRKTIASFAMKTIE